MIKDDLIIKLKSIMLDIIGVEIYYRVEIDDDLRDKRTFDKGTEEVLNEGLNEYFDMYIDLSTMNPLTINNIADLILQLKPGGLAVEKKREVMCNVS